MAESQLADKVGYGLMVHDVDQVYTFLWKSLLNEIIHDARNQKEFKSHLSDLIEQRRVKYRPFFDKIGREMPIELAELKPEEICTVLSVDLMTPEELKKYHEEKIVVLFNGFQKKTQKTPASEITKALKIKEEYYEYKRNNDSGL